MGILGIYILMLFMWLCIKCPGKESNTTNQPRNPDAQPVNQVDNQNTANQPSYPNAQPGDQVDNQNTTNQLSKPDVKPVNQVDNQKQTKVQISSCSLEGMQRCADITKAFKNTIGNFNWITTKEKSDPNVPLVVLCRDITRLQADVKLAIDGRSSEYAVIMIHKGHAKPEVTSSEKLETEGKNVHFVKIIDTWLTDDLVFPKSDFNKRAFSNLQKYIHAFRHC